MVGKYAIIGFLFLLAGCAQVGQLSGGPEDQAAPKPIEAEMVPAQASTNYTGNSFLIPFDEYFTLNNPAQTIVMVPPHAQVTAEVKRKTLTLSWDETLEPNTTYAIYLNGTVRDVNERNDTTLQLVFSTGDQIDTLSYTVPVMDAFSQEPLSDVTVALFDPETNKLLSLTKSNEGRAKLNYLRAGTYQLMAFEDENGDLEIQNQERIGFPDGGLVRIDSNYFDSVPLRVFKPTEIPKIETIEPVSPCVYKITFNEHMLSVPTLSIDGDMLDDEAFNLDNSLEGTFFFNSGEKKSFEVVAQNQLPAFSDTTNIRIKPLKDSSIVIRGSIDARIASDTKETTIELETNAWLFKGGSLDTSLVALRNKKDSTLYKPIGYSVEHRVIRLIFAVSTGGEYEMELDAGAILSACGRSSKALKKNIDVLDEKDFGTLRLNFSAYGSPLYVEIMKGKEVVEKGRISSAESLAEFTLLPGEYWVRVVVDTNENGQWDPGNYATLTQPERVDTYSKTTKVRANWTVDVPLTPSESP